VVEQARQQLPELVPSGRMRSVGKRIRAKLLQYGQKIGYSQEELAQAYDPRAVAALYKAMKIRRVGVEDRPTCREQGSEGRLCGFCELCTACNFRSHQAETASRRNRPRAGCGGRSLNACFEALRNDYRQQHVDHLLRRRVSAKSWPTSSTTSTPTDVPFMSNIGRENVKSTYFEVADRTCLASAVTHERAA